MSARVRIRAALCLALVLANSGPAQADSRVYRWTDDEGNVHITATPPPEGAHPAPAQVPEPKARDRLQIVPETPAAGAAEPAPETGVPPAPPAPRARADDPDSCAKYAVLVGAWLNAQRRIPALEAAVEQIESDPIQASASETCPRYSPCTYSSFSREEALRKANEALRSAEERVADAEERARQAGTPDRCLVDPSE